MKTVDAFPINTASTSCENLSHRATSMFFGRIAQELNQEARILKLNTPVFRSPPKIVGLTRMIKHPATQAITSNETEKATTNESSVLYIAIRDRSKTAVCADAIDGLLECNTQLDIVEKMHIRERLWERVNELIYNVEPQTPKLSQVPLAKSA